MIPTPVVQLSQLRKKFGTNDVFNGIDLSIAPGKFHALLGRNGSGKSTLLKILMRYELPDSGTGMVLGNPLDEDRAGYNRGLGFVSEQIDFSLPLKIRDLFGELSTIYDNWDGKLFAGILEAMKINPDHFYRDLSRGQKMQVAMGWVLATRPKLLLLDEITAVLDAHARGFYMGHLQEFVDRGGTVIMATNIVSEVQNNASDIILLEAGKVKFQLPKEEIASKFIKLRKHPSVLHPAFTDPACEVVSLNSDGSNSYLLPADRASLYPLPAEMSDRRRITIEELFVYFTRQHPEEAK